jgi:hypothetical protein
VGINEQNGVIFYSITVPRKKRLAIKDFFIIDCIVGTSLYYTLKVCSSSELLSLFGSMIGVTSIKQTAFLIKKRRETKVIPLKKN